MATVVSLDSEDSIAITVKINAKHNINLDIINRVAERMLGTAKLFEEE